MKLKPLADRVLVERAVEGDKTEGGIVLPDTAKEKLGRGKVVEAGPGAPDSDGKPIPLAVKKGDQVVFHPEAGHEIEQGGKKFLVLREQNVLAIIEDDKKKPKK